MSGLKNILTGGLLFSKVKKALGDKKKVETPAISDRAATQDEIDIAAKKRKSKTAQRSTILNDNKKQTFGGY